MRKIIIPFLCAFFSSLIGQAHAQDNEFRNIIEGMREIQISTAAGHSEIYLTQSINALQKLHGSISQRERLELKEIFTQLKVEFAFSDQLFLTYYKSELNYFLANGDSPYQAYQKMSVVLGLFSDSHTYLELFLKLLNKIKFQFCDINFGEKCLNNKDLLLWGHLLDAVSNLKYIAVTNTQPTFRFFKTAEGAAL